MSSSIIIARLLGPLMLASAAAILVNRKGIQKAADTGARNPAFVYLDGVLGFVAGLAIVEFHNLWMASWQTIITVVGWAMLVSGAARMLAPDHVASMGKTVAAREAALAIIGAISGILGFILTLQAFTA